MKRPIIIGAQKLYLRLQDALAFSQQLRDEVRPRSLPFDLVVCPSFINLTEVAKVLRGSNISIGAQNVHQEDTGAFTGQVSIHELIEQKVSHVIIGHSELRAQQGETNAMVRRKAEVCLRHDVVPIICMGDTREDWEAGRSTEVVARDLKEMLDPPIAVGDVRRIVLAYEPVWAIKRGTNDKRTASATPEIANQMHSLIQSIVADIYGQEVAGSIRVVYGGSVNKENTRDLLLQDNIDGLLVGTASVKLDSFLPVLDAAAEATQETLYASAEART